MIMNKEKYEDFFIEIRKFKQEQNKQKQRGLNNYNLLTTVLKADDEVRLHSRMIRSLLDVNGEHYQHTLFLEIFLDILNLKDFELNIDSVKVYTEYHDIDIYITDGTKHIILENKIWAKDQPCQIIKYINIIKEENKEEENELKVDKSKIQIIEDIYVLYLTPNDNKKVPDEHHLDNGYISFSGNEEKLKECSLRSNTERLVENGLKNYQVKYKKITYKKEIKKWLVKSKYEVQNITNLNEAISQYIDVVDKINGKYEGKVKKMKELLLKNDNLKLAIELEQAITESKIEIQVKFWNILKKELLKYDYDFKFVNYDFNEMNITEECKKYYPKHKYYGLKYDIYNINEKNKLSFYIEIEDNIYYGLTFSESGVRREIAKKDIFSDISKLILDKNISKWDGTNMDKGQIWWLARKYPLNKLDFRNFNSDNIFTLVSEIVNSEDNVASIRKIAKDIDEILKETKKIIKQT